MLLRFLPLAVVTLAPPCQEPLTTRVQEALGKARPALMHHLQRVQGSALGLVCLAAVHDGLDPADPVLARALDDLRRTEIEDTYGLALRLMLMAEIERFPDRELLAARDTELLLGKQTTGGFSYRGGDGWWDLSNTQYAALGLRAAAALGQEIPQRQWRLLYDAVHRMQHDDGGFGYRAGQGRTSSNASMTAAGIAVLAVCGQHVPLDEFSRKILDDHLALGWEWLAEHGSEIGDRRTQSCLYFHYGLERAAILCDVEKVGPASWYQRGAEMLLDMQLGGGGWNSPRDFRPDAPGSGRGHPVDTSFAVLFLRRKFQKVQAPVTGPRGCRSVVLPEDATDAAIDGAALADARAGLEHMADLLRCFYRPRVAPRRAASKAILQIAGQDFGLVPALDAAGNTAALRAAELWFLRQRRDAAK